MGWFRSLRHRHREKKEEQRILAEAETWVPEDCVLVEALAPRDDLGVFVAPDAPQEVEVAFHLRCLGVAPFAVQPNRLKISIELLFSGDAAGSTEVVDLPLTSEFLMSGTRHVEPIKAQIKWVASRTPEPNQAIRMEVRGEVRLLGPWKVEYKAVRFKSSVYLVARHLPGVTVHHTA